MRNLNQRIAAGKTAVGVIRRALRMPLIKGFDGVFGYADLIRDLSKRHILRT